MPTTVETAQELGLRPEEFEKIKEILGRVPNFCELSVYSVMWSEHCSYKNSIIWLKTLPRESDKMLAKAGEENAGLIDIGDGLACCFKIESHNHPSALEPYQGAATGVGGINRDIFSMGARPIAQLNSLRFGNLKNDRTKWLVKGVVKGIGDYGNAFGIPTVGGEVYFDDCYEINPLVNAMSVGIVEVGKTLSATSTGVGNPVYIFGSSTGKDGIHGAAFASKDITEDSAKDLPSVQVGDPFWEKLIMEATLELIPTGGVIGLQDMGAAGITCSTSEMSAKDGFGMDVWLDKVPMRQPGMKDWEILLSESQERMLVVMEKGFEKKFEQIFEKWDLTYAQIGEVTEGGNVRYFMNGELVGDIPAESLALGGGAPVYKREYAEPAYVKEIAMFDMAAIADSGWGEGRGKLEVGSVARQLAAHPNIASKRWVYRQYDSMVGTLNQSTNKPSDAAVVKLRGTDKSLLMTVDCNSRYVYANPEQGAAIAVSEAARNIVCSGGEPLGVTNCLNFGNPYNPGVYWQFVGAINGMGKACKKFGTPVTGGNVSFYNQSSDNDAVFPTPTIGMVGIMESDNCMTLDFKNEGDLIYLLGHQKNDIASSQYLVSVHGVQQSPCPYFDLEEEYSLQQAVKSLIQNKQILSAHDCSEGGLFIALLESAMAGGKGFDASTKLRMTEDGIWNMENGIQMRKDSFLFGEAQSRVVVSISPNQKEAFEAEMREHDVPCVSLGSVTTGNISIDGNEMGEVEEYSNSYETALETALA
ncbi:MAG: phosphoribosylformylglycinamidine synthase subunit PurL [Flavobacteriaceae bacterium]|nr:phosphoribosylformylglycinamidine synthase subunit PurL [Flavobacteriaceae bacterium]